MTVEEFKRYQKIAADKLEEIGIILTDTEKMNIEVADFALGEFEKIGLSAITYINTEKVCAKEMILLPHQTCPEHRHPKRASDDPGKEETFRCRYGLVYLYVEGEASEAIKARIPEGSEDYFTVFHEIVLKPGEQYTLMPNTWHWFQAGEEGAVVSEFSTKSTDESDIFTDPRIQRIPDIR